MKALNFFLYILFLLLAIGIGLYPLLYFLVDFNGGLLNTKSDELLANSIWYTCFYLHIFFGGLALLSGCTQFSERLRSARIKLHRRLGQIYVISVFLSGTSGLYIAGFATGGWVSILGFSSLAIAWLITTYLAYSSIRKKAIEVHRRWMIRSYALSFAAVTLRLWLPILIGGFGLDFFTAYPLVAWLCWVPNWMLVELFLLKGS